MRILIENYRGWDIHFDTDSEQFYTISNQYDTDKVKKTYKSTKKYIDDYIKENENFTPFYATDELNNKILIIGLRKDGAFMYEDKEGSKQQLSKYSEKNYFKYSSSNDIVFKNIDVISDKIELLRKEIREERNKLIKEPLKL